MKSRVWLSCSIVILFCWFAHWARGEQREVASDIPVPVEVLIDRLQVVRNIDGALTGDFVRRFPGGVDPFALPPVASPPGLGAKAIRGDEFQPSFALGSPAYSVAAEIDGDADMETTMTTVQLRGAAPCLPAGEKENEKHLEHSHL